MSDTNNMTGSSEPTLEIEYQVFRKQPDGSLTWEEVQTVSEQLKVTEGLKAWIAKYMNNVRD